MSQYVIVTKQHSSHVIFVAAIALSAKLHKRLQQQAVTGTCMTVKQKQYASKECVCMQEYCKECMSVAVLNTLMVSPCMAVVNASRGPCGPGL